jgi:hypothetical protein
MVGRWAMPVGSGDRTDIDSEVSSRGFQEDIEEKVTEGDKPVGVLYSLEYCLFGHSVHRAGRSKWIY